MPFPKQIQNLINQLQALPDIGPKTAVRYAFFIQSLPEKKIQEIAKAIENINKDIGRCKMCRRLIEINNESLCNICRDTNREKNSLCIVEQDQDIEKIESTGQYKGLYFVLGSLIKPHAGQTPAKERIRELMVRISLSWQKKNVPIKEIIFALNPTTQGEATILYIRRLLQKSISDQVLSQIKITRLGTGLPLGADLRYADPDTLKNALLHRNQL